MAFEDHLKYRRMYFNPDVPETLFEEYELEILRNYGAWLAALMKGVIQPNTAAQSRFVEVCNGVKKPKTEYELVWTRFIERKKWEAENPDYVGKENKVLAGLGITGQGWGVYGRFR